jgi:hypothetical protein
MTGDVGPQPRQSLSTAVGVQSCHPHPRGDFSKGSVRVVGHPVKEGER